MADITAINSKARRLVDADSTTWTAANLLIDINQAYEEVVSDILGMDGLWQFDDTNFTDFPIGRTNLVADQQDYTFASDVLEVERVSFLDANGDYQPLQPIDHSQFSQDPTELFPESGTPVYYDKQGKSILLYPAPASGDVTLTNGLKVFYKRTADIYTSAEVTTGTKEPGFASPFHMILAYKAALTYALSYKPERIPLIEREIAKFEKRMRDFYGRREQDRRKVATMEGVSFR